MSRKRFQKTEHSKGFHIKINKKWLFINAVALLVIVALLVTGYFFSTKKTEGDVLEIKNDKIYTTTNDAQKLLMNKDKNGAVKVYDDAIEASKNDKEKANLMMAKAAIYMNDGNYDKAFELAKQAESINTTFAEVEFLARLYTIKGQKDLAVEYLQKTIDLSDKNSPTYDSDVAMYKDQLKQLREGE